MPPEILRLHLQNPLYYKSDSSLEPFGGAQKPLNEEMLFCFKLEQSIANNFEPDIKSFPGILVFSGFFSEMADKKITGKNSAQVLELPSGNYLFAQERKLLDREKIIFMAMEIQNEGLWQRLKLGSCYYLRFLYEDNSMVTQIFRPIEPDSESG